MLAVAVFHYFCGSVHLFAPNKSFSAENCGLDFVASKDFSEYSQPGLDNRGISASIMTGFAPDIDCIPDSFHFQFPLKTIMVL